MDPAVKPPVLLRPLLWMRRRWKPLAVLAALVLAGLSWGLWRLAQLDRRDAVRWIGQKAGFELEVGSVSFPSASRLEIRGLRVEDFARVERLEVDWSTAGLASRTIDSLRASGVEIRLGRMQEALARRRKPGAASDSSGSFRFTLKQLILADSRLVLDNLGPGIPPLPIRLGEVTPLVFNNLQLGGSTADPAAQDIQIAELENIVLHSPYDPLTPVLSFGLIRVGFSWAGIEKKQLDQLVLVEPVIYVGPDLFWFSDRMKEAAAQAPRPAAATTPWTIANFEIRAGQLVLAPDGQQTLRLPLLFETRETGLVLSDFSELRLTRAGFKIPPTNLDYPEYQVRINGMEGELYFSLPVEERGTKDLSNLTPTLKIASASWKGLEVRGLSVSATFDRKGIYGQVSGQCYQGGINGGFTVLLDNAMSWKAWASTTGVDLGPVTNLLSPEHFVMRGTVDSAFAVEARSRNIERFSGKIDLNRPGTMEITAIDRVLRDLPEGWSSLKREISRVGLEAFQFYEYDGGSAEVTYAPPTSRFALALDGPRGKRNFTLTWEDQGLLARKSTLPQDNSPTPTGQSPRKTKTPP